MTSHIIYHAVPDWFEFILAYLVGNAEINDDITVVTKANNSEFIIL